MAKNDPQAAQDQQMQEGGIHPLPPPSVEPPVKTAAKMPEQSDDDPVTVIWKSWGTTGMPRGKVTYFDRHQFTGGVGRRIPYKDAKKWRQQGHGIHILPIDAQEIDFIKATGHAPMQDSELEAMLRSVPMDKLAAMLGPENLDKIAEMRQKQQ